MREQSEYQNLKDFIKEVKKQQKNKNSSKKEKAIRCCHKKSKIYN